ncbi:aminoacyl-tRNA hydrolase [Oleiagrimonas sp.]|jgi:PTH1 family peptidyl-tRNA hydrolase|uniref:aminoacyl-tRNA hydrolase n=1 Tax=Oleiagrimonas sp. TaxID=2010330 RepID=UPI002634C4EA|nr:aminoacyl-tRNA hydrolase [Oleiagrimonas sp.]MDA3912572.1 aminoacyl-tRNA hydrolase [Oleiagrimonas sp.]
MSRLRLIIGLGNPGAEYLGTRHNAGFWFVDALALAAGESFSHNAKLHGHACRVDVDGQPVWLLKPDTFMNKSGIAVVSALRYYKIEPHECLVVHDDLDLEPGVARLKADGGHGGQNGLRDIIAHLGHGRFHRLRIGIGHPGDRDRVTPWVLGRPAARDEEAMLDAIARASHQLPLLVNGKYGEAMKRLHTNGASQDTSGA